MWAHHPRTRILLAVTPEVAKHLLEVVDRRYETVIAKNITDAVAQLEQSHFDLVICGYHFDDCRMIEMVTAVNEKMPHPEFLCLRELPSQLSGEIEKMIAKSVLLMGACDYIAPTGEQSGANIMAVVERILDNNVEQRAL